MAEFVAGLIDVFSTRENQWPHAWPYAPGADEIARSAKGYAPPWQKLSE